ncbi:MAG: hypothetical protein WDN69_22945 [Aliidongia sp.]
MEPASLQMVRDVVFDPHRLLPAATQHKADDIIELFRRFRIGPIPQALKLMGKINWQQGVLRAMGIDRYRHRPVSACNPSVR